MTRVDLIRKLLETNHLSVPERRALMPRTIRAPFAERFIGCQSDSLLALVTAANDLEQQAGLQHVEAEVTDLVNYQELRLSKRVELSVQRAIAARPRIPYWRFMTRFGASIPRGR